MLDQRITQFKNAYERLKEALQKDLKQTYAKIRYYTSFSLYQI